MLAKTRRQQVFTFTNSAGMLTIHLLLLPLVLHMLAHNIAHHCWRCLDSALHPPQLDLE